MKNGLVKKSNDLLVMIESKWKLNLIQSKIFAYLISKIHKDDETIKSYTFSIKQLFLDLNMHEKSYEKLYKATGSIIQKGYTEIIRKDGGIHQGVIFTADYDKNRTKITMNLNEHLIPHLIKLTSKFTQYELENILKLNSRYAIRIYEYCVYVRGAKRKECVINITIAELRKNLNIDKKKYKLFSNFKNRILVPARKEINKSVK